MSQSHNVHGRGRGSASCHLQNQAQDKEWPWIYDMGSLMVEEEKENCQNISFLHLIGRNKLYSHSWVNQNVDVYFSHMEEPKQVL